MGAPQKVIDWGSRCYLQSHAEYALELLQEEWKATAGEAMAHHKPLDLCRRYARRSMADKHSPTTGKEAVDFSDKLC